MGDKHQDRSGLCNNIRTVNSSKLGGKIWVSTTNGACSYQCIFCDCTFESANSFEKHIPIAHIDQRRSVPQPRPPSPRRPPSPPWQVARLEMRHQSHLERVQNGSVPNHNQSAGYRKSNDFQGATDHRRNSIDANRRRPSIDMNRRRISIDTHRYRESYEQSRGKPNVPPQADAQHHRRHVKFEVEPFHCMKCDSRFRSFESLRDHVRRRHSICCTHCVDTKNDVNAPKTFETEKGLWSHQRAHHAKEFPYKCDVCVRSFQQRQQRKDHMETKHVRGNNVKCDFCSKILMSTFQKKNHIKRNHSNRRYYCQLCKCFHFTNAKKKSFWTFFLMLMNFIIIFSFRQRLSDHRCRLFEASHKGETSR